MSLSKAEQSLLKPIQVDFIRERLQSTTDAAAARAIGRTPAAISQWKNKLVIDAIVTRLQAAPILQAQQVLIDAAVKASMVKIEGLESVDETVRQSAASDILDRIGITRRPMKPLDEDFRFVDDEELSKMIHEVISGEYTVIGEEEVDFG